MTDLETEHPRQFVTCKFREEDKREYTYHNDGPPMVVGDRVETTGRGGHQVFLKVTGIIDEEPPFATKAVIPAPPLPEREEEKAVQVDDFGGATEIPEF